jgi:Ankyrin repeats (3 copies)/Ankyrin repeat
VATELLSAAEAGPWSEDKVPPAERGVSLLWLCDFVGDLQAKANAARRQAMKQADNAREQNKMAKWDPLISEAEIPEIPPYYCLNTHALVSQSIVPLTKEIDAPLFALVPPKYRGKPAVFISHTWNSLLFGAERQRIGTLDTILDEENDQFVWIDFACYNQNRVSDSDISADMFEIIKKIGRVFVAVTPTPLYNRSWCLWELYSADTIGLPLDFRIYRGFRNDKIQSVNALYRSFIGVENAHSINAQADEQIHNAFITRHGSLEKANAAVKDILKRQLSGRWQELQPDDGPLKFSADPWVADPDGANLRAYDPYWEPGLLDAVIYGGKETVREVFARAGVYIGAQEKATLAVQKSDPANERLIVALQNEDVEAITELVYQPTVDVNKPLPFRSVLSFDVAPPLHFLMPWAKLRTIEALALFGANPYEPWTYPPETKSAEAAQREALVRALLNGVGDPHQAEWTPLMLAVQRGDANICIWLIEHGALIPLPSPPPPGAKSAFVNFKCRLTGLTALHVAAANKRKDLVELLTQSGAAVDVPLISGVTALHIAAIVGDVDSIALLLKCGANKELRDRTGQSARDWAQRCKHPEAASLLGSPITYATLRQTFIDDWPTPSGTFQDDVLWTLHLDPDPAASLKLGCNNPPFPVVDATFEKKRDGITSTVHVKDDTDQQRPSQTTVMHHTLVDGAWQSKAIGSSDEAAVSKTEKAIAAPAAAAPPPAATTPAASTMTTYDTLKNRFRQERPVLSGPSTNGAFLNEVLWTLQRDPAPAASVTLGYENPPHYDVEVTFNKALDGIESTLRVTDDDGRPMHTIKARYSLVDGAWKAEETSNWQRG